MVVVAHIPCLLAARPMHAFHLAHSRHKLGMVGKTDEDDGLVVQGSQFKSNVGFRSCGRSFGCGGGMGRLRLHKTNIEKWTIAY